MHQLEIVGFARPGQPPRAPNRMPDNVIPHPAAAAAEYRTTGYGAVAAAPYETEYQEEQEVGAPHYVGSDHEYDYYDQEVEVVGMTPEVDVTGARTGRMRQRRLGRKKRRIARRKSRLENRLGRLEAKEVGIERDLQSGMQPGYRQVDTGGCAKGVGDGSMWNSASISNGASGSLTCTPQMTVYLEDWRLASSANLDAVLVTAVQVGVDNIFTNTEASNGLVASFLARDSTLVARLRGRRVTPQTPFRITATNNHTAAQTVGIFVQANKDAGAESGAR